MERKMVEISKIVEQNPWWKFGEEFRSYDKTMNDYEMAEIQIGRKEIVVLQSNIYSIYGPRQVGKTTELKKAILKLIREGVDPNCICYFSCDALASAKELEKVLNFFLDRLVRHEKVYLFLDEINFVKDWVPRVKRIADSERFSKVAVLITGSPFGIKVHTHELIGRGVEGNRHYLKPLSFRDFAIQVCVPASQLTPEPSMQAELKSLRFHLKDNYIDLERHLGGIEPVLEGTLKFLKSLNFLFDIYLRTGGFPMVINSYMRNFAEGEKVEARFYEMFIELVTRDVMKQGKSDRIMQQILTAVAKKVGSRHDFKSIGEETEDGVSHPTVIDYLQLLEDNFLIHVLYSYDFQKRRPKPRGAKKIYFADPFISHAFNSWLHGKSGYSYSEEFLLNEVNFSILVEGTVQGSLSRTKEVPVLKPADKFLWFYYDARKELDFIYRRENGEHLGIEAKFRPRVSFKDVPLVEPVREYLLLSKDEFDVGENRVIVPASVFLCLLRNSEKNL